MATNIELYDVYLNGAEVITGADSVMYSEYYGKGEARTAHGGGKILNYAVQKLDSLRQTVKFKVPVTVGNLRTGEAFRNAQNKAANGEHTIVLKPQLAGRKPLTFNSCVLTENGEVSVSEDNSTEFTFEGLHQVA